MKIIDCFNYFDEDKILDLRLNILNDYVDQFVIVEAKEDHQGNKKKLNFKINNFRKFSKKINYIIQNKIEIDKNLIIKKNWAKDHLRDQSQRNYIIKGLKNTSDEDWIIISDIDEIPNPKSFYLFNPNNKFAFFKQRFFYYKLNLLNKTTPFWYGSRICVKKYLKSPQWLRNFKIKKRNILNKLGFYNYQIIDNGGWHFSFIKDPAQIIKKIESFAHTELNIPKFKDKKKILQKIKNRKDLFDRNILYKKINLDNSFPDYLLHNKNSYKKWII
jgi:beta-1,4-mannosyl-glycoprotein beta-1,4-N-acetylglucosaminyltransferase